MIRSVWLVELYSELATASWPILLCIQLNEHLTNCQCIKDRERIKEQKKAAKAEKKRPRRLRKGEKLAYKRSNSGSLSSSKRMIHAQDTETYKDHRVHTFSGMHQRQPLLGRGGGNPSRETRTSNSEGFLRQEVSLPLLQGQVPSEGQFPDIQQP